MTANPSGCPCGREENDRVSAELNVGPQGRLLIGAEDGLVWIEAEGLKSSQVDREGHGHRSHRQISGHPKAGSAAALGVNPAMEGHLCCSPNGGDHEASAHRH
jgi:hypothetical protein